MPEPVEDRNERLKREMQAESRTTNGVALPVSPASATVEIEADEPDHVREERLALADTHASADRDGGEPTHVQRVQSALARMRATADAKAIFDAEQGGPPQPFDAGTLRQVLARPKPPPHRIKDVLPWESGLLLVAQHKVGKTTLVLNMADSLITGDPFLGVYEVRPLDGNVAILNYEVSAHMLAGWANDLGVAEDRLLLVNLRGRRNPLRYPADRQALAALLRAHDVEALITDPFGRAYTGQSQNDPAEVGAWLADLDQFGRSEAGVRDMMLTVHTGWNGERTRGSSALNDWADSIVTLVKDPDTGQRFIHADGRDIDIPEQELGYTGRRLRLTGAGSRKDARDQAKRRDQEAAVLRVLGGLSEPLHTTALEEAIKAQNAADAKEGVRTVGFQRGDVSQACNRLLNKGLVSMTAGDNNKKLWARITLVDAAGKRIADGSGEGGERLV